MGFHSSINLETGKAVKPRTENPSNSQLNGKVNIALVSHVLSVALGYVLLNGASPSLYVYRSFWEMYRLTAHIKSTYIARPEWEHTAQYCHSSSSLCLLVEHRQWQSLIYFKYALDRQAVTSIGFRLSRPLWHISSASL